MAQDPTQNQAGSSDGITLTPRVVKITTRTGIDIRRTLPHKKIRTIGAWCFVDHYGPTDQANAMSVAAHPHAGLQTVSWLFSGEIEHRDSVGSIQKISPGELNIMTAGRGVSHSELSLQETSIVHGIQLWTVLPDAHRRMEPTFHHHSQLPVIMTEDLAVKVFVGEIMGHASQAEVYSELLGAEIDVRESASTQIETNPLFEYGVLLVQGDIHVDGFEVPLGSLQYLPVGRNSIAFSSVSGAKVVLLGGKPFEEEILMWWNFIGRTHEEIETLRDDWNGESDLFPSFPDRIGGRIPAPEMPNLRLFPRGNS